MQARDEAANERHGRRAAGVRRSQGQWSIQPCQLHPGRSRLAAVPVRGT